MGIDRSLHIAMVLAAADVNWPIVLSYRPMTREAIAQTGPLDHAVEAVSAAPR